MAILPLVMAPNPVFSRVSTPVSAVDDSVRALLADMMDTLHDAEAIGLAAPMIGMNLRLVVIHLTDHQGLHSYQMVNPEIMAKSELEVTQDEASVCFPDVVVSVRRPAEITVRFLDETGASREISARGILAACIQHELDYLDGVTILDYVSSMKRDMLMRRMKKAIRLGRYHHHHSDACSHG